VRAVLSNAKEETDGEETGPESIPFSSSLIVPVKTECYFNGFPDVVDDDIQSTERGWGHIQHLYLS
jgi:hypothetical protein